MNRRTALVMRDTLWEDLWRRAVISVLLFAALLTFGTTGFIVIEGWGFLDAIYMTVTTVTTVGYREVQPLSDGGRIFTVFLIVFGVGVALYVLTSIVQIAVEGEVGRLLGVRRMRGKINVLQQHYILCGFGRVGEEIAQEFSERRVQFVVVESNPEAIGRLQAMPYLYVEGDATQDPILREAGIDRSRGLLAASDSDSDNTYIVLTARALNPDIFIVARAGRPNNIAKLRRAGANRVISPYLIGGRRMALSALQPLMVDFIDTLATGRHGEQLLGEIAITEESGLAGMSLRQAMTMCPTSTVLGVQRSDGTLTVGPNADHLLAVGDRLMVFGVESELERLSSAVVGRGEVEVPSADAAEAPPAPQPT